MAFARAEQIAALAPDTPAGDADMDHRAARNARTWSAIACHASSFQFQCAAGEGEGKIQIRVGPMVSRCSPNPALGPRNLRPPVRLVKARMAGANFAMRARKAAVASWPRLPGGNCESMPDACLAMSVRPMRQSSS